MHTFVFITNCIGDPACITYSFMMKLLVALIALVVTGFLRFLVVVCGFLHPCWVLGRGSYLSWLYGPVWWCNLMLPVCGQLGIINCQRCFLDLVVLVMWFFAVYLRTSRFYGLLLPYSCVKRKNQPDATYFII